MTTALPRNLNDEDIASSSSAIEKPVHIMTHATIPRVTLYFILCINYHA